MTEEQRPFDPRTDKEVLASKLRLLLEVIHDKDTPSYTFEQVQAGLAEQNVSLTRTRWHRLLAGSPDNRWDPELLKALAYFFDVDENYLLQRSGPIPDRVEAELKLIEAYRVSEVEHFAARALGDVSVDALKAITEALKAFRPTDTSG
ncbi:hypothetical protein [Paenarthrobacter histidinolovorans]|uniref:XRE family transcriptional regulator n=1 Tax=Paenarthrobacter histidinolovorans TaxID=43664 RepID=A0ABW8N2D8_9MICC